MVREGRLAIDGGVPVRSRLLPYGRQTIAPEDIDSVVDVLQSDWLTTGPQVEDFESEFAAAVGTRYAIAVSSGTAALLGATSTLGLGPGDEVIVPSMTFVATANSVVFTGAKPVFADVCSETLLLGPEQVDARVTAHTKAVIAVDYAGQPCDYDGLRSYCEARNLVLVADSCHALGARYKGRPVGGLADMSTFSFHPVKHIATGEGGMVATDSAALAQQIERFRNHGIASDHRQRQKEKTWFYEMIELGFNYRLTDIQCALGRSQLGRLSEMVDRRRQIAARYDRGIPEIDSVSCLEVRPEVEHSFHLYVIRLEDRSQGCRRSEVFSAMRAEGIGVNVHYIPVHLHPFYRDRFGLSPGLCPTAEKAYSQVLSLPLFPAMTNDDVDDVLVALKKVVAHFYPK